MSSFSFYGTFDFAKQFARLPVDFFLQLVEEELEKRSKMRTTEQQKRVIFIGCHPRCGGSLLTQLFEDDEYLQRADQGKTEKFAILP